MFEKSYFIKPDIEFDARFLSQNPAPIFRKSFHLEKTENAVINVCALGIGYFYINGKPISEDLFTAPVSDYRKTLWYTSYDVTDLLCEGKNTVSAILGDGWHNEPFKTAWNHNEASWRDLPKLICQLDIDGKTVLVSDDTWKCTPTSAVTFNAIRSGEYFDSRLYDEAMFDKGYDDSKWNFAQLDNNAPQGTFRECICEPIRECEVFPAVSVIKTGDMRYVFDICQNISGYVRIKTTGKCGDELIIRYSEQLHPDNTRRLNDMETYYLSENYEFQTDKFICNGKPFTWSPRFAYHGFRYIEIDGIRDINDIEVSGVFVHQAVEKRMKFECSNPLLNKLFYMGQMATYSNMFYSLTDCPTREKLGWMNDAQSSAEQIMTDFKAEKFFSKWSQDIFDAVNEEGALPGIVPTPLWGYDWGNGPVSDGAMFEIPYVIYKHTGDATLLKAALPYFKKYLSYLDTRVSESGFVEFGLCDWANPLDSQDFIPTAFINPVLMYSFYNKAALSAKLCGNEDDENYFTQRGNKLLSEVKKAYIDEKGECTVCEMTAVAMLIYFDMYDKLTPLSNQLKRLVEENNMRHKCGMVGLRRLYIALNKCGLQEYAYKIITAEGYPSYKGWIDSGATTLQEFWDVDKDSKNHHMYSDFMSWMVKTILGISIDEEKLGSVTINIEPFYFEDLTYAKGIYNTVKGDVNVEWKRENESINLSITIDEGVCAYYKGKLLKCGRNGFVI